MPQPTTTQPISHGPANAEHEIRKAYFQVLDASALLEARGTPGVRADELTELYRRAFNAHRDGERLAAERWARTTKHLARAFRHEAMITYLEPRLADLPFLTGATADEYNLRNRSDTAADLLNSVENHIEDDSDELRAQMSRYLGRARAQLERLTQPGLAHELLRVELINCAHEYGRVLECMELALEAEAQHKRSA